jgi:hypothetical protein
MLCIANWLFGAKEQTATYAVSKTQEQHVKNFFLQGALGQK